MIELAPDLIPALNQTLREEAEAEEHREDWAGRPIPVKKRRLLDEDERYGLLVEDMSCGNYLYKHDQDSDEEADGAEKQRDLDEEWKDMATVEFKPKWLSQSPNAPNNWKLCRTCAIRLMNGKRSAPNEMGEGGEDEYCPLDLASGDKDRIEAAVFAIVNTQNSVMIADPTPGSDDEDEEMADAGGFGGGDELTTVAHELAKLLESSLILLLTRFFRESPIIPTITQLQSRFGSRGVFTSATLALMSETDPLPSEEEMAKADLATAEENDIWTAMTLRDCSLFVRIWVRRRKGKGMEARVECKVGDLDLKTGAGGRAVYWRDVERRLRQGGWYLARDSERDCRAGTGTL